MSDAPGPRVTNPGEESTRQILKEALITGIALTIPLAITLFVLGFAVGFLTSQLDPLVNAIAATFDIGSDAAILAVEILTLVGLLVLLTLIGLAASTSAGHRIEMWIDNVIEGIPGIGAVYSSFNEMSEMLLDSDSESFQEVVLVEYPSEGSYCVAFLTSETPEVICSSAGHDEMRTVFMPMGPNPFMGGFVLYLSEERIHDVDMSVEEGIQSIVTSGTAIAEEPEGEHDEEATDRSPAGGAPGPA